MTDNAIVSINENAIIRPVQSVDQALVTYQDMVEFTKRAMTKDQDYGIIPGTEKPTLYKPGAEKLCRFFGLSSTIRIDREVENWDADEPFFYYRVHCTIYRMGTDIVVAEGMGSCNSRESRYRWRWVDEADVPPNLDTSKLVTRRASKSEFQFAIDKAETTGKYGKPAEYWQEFKDAITDGSARSFMKGTKSGQEYPAWEIASVSYRVPNEDIASQVNTILKMAKKRAFIDATLTATNASEFYTQDMEDYDFAPAGDVVDSTAVPVEETQQAVPAPKLVEPENFLRDADNIVSYVIQLIEAYDGPPFGLTQYHASINGLFQSEEERHDFQSFVMGKQSSKDFTDAERHALVEYFTDERMTKDKARQAIEKVVKAYRLDVPVEKKTA
jgi:hypothetical protein